MRTIAAALALTTILPFAASAEQTTPPAPAPAREVHIPRPSEKTLDNGLRVIVVQKGGLPLVAARLLVKTGGEADPADHAGLADMTASLLTKGTATRSAEEIARGVEALGATIESGAGWDFSSVSLTALATTFPAAMNFFADVVLHPTFKAEEVDRLREQNLDAIRVALRRPSSIANFVASRVIYGGTPYGHSLGGTPQSLPKITPSDVKAFHASYYRPDNAVLVVAGDIQPGDAFALAEKMFGKWKAPAAAQPQPLRTEVKDLPAKPRVVVVDMPDAGQAAVVVTQRGIARVDPLYNVAEVTNAILGGGYSSRLNQEVRIKRGLSYGAGSSFSFRREAGPFSASAQTKNESASEVAGLILGEMSRMAETSIPESELTPRKAVLVGNFGRSLETNAGLVARVGSLAVYGLSLDEINAYIRNVEGVSAADVQSFSKGHMASGSSVVIVGDAKKFLDALRKQFPDVEVIPVSKLDLDSPALMQ